MRFLIGEIMDSFDKHYLVLGLRRGATQEEIRSAFQRMTDKYHPDKDSSLDAQMKFHEARQAYAALSNTAGAKTSGPTAGTQQTAYDDELDDIIKDLVKAPEEKDVLPTASLNDYFFRPESIFIIVGSMLLFFVIERSLLSDFPNPHELSTRFFMHMTVSIFASWLIIGHVRLTSPSRSATLITVVILGVIYGLLHTNFTFRQEHLQAISCTITQGIMRQRGGWSHRWGPGGNNLVSASIVHVTIFFCIFYSATYLLEATLKRRLKKSRRSRNA